MFFDNSLRLEQSWYGVTKGIFVPDFIEVSTVVSDKKIFKVFYIDIVRENKPHPLATMFDKS